MPSSRPQAAFEPIAPSTNLKELVESTPNFEWATRIHCDMIDHHGLEQFERLVLVHVVLGGKPLVIEGYESRLDKWTFAVQWLRDNHGTKGEPIPLFAFKQVLTVQVVDVRELNKDTNVPMTMEHYLKHMTALTNQWTDNNYKEEGRQRMYLKDMDCPQIWHEKLRDHIPLGLFYLNESTGDIDGFGAQEEPDPNGPGLRTGRGVAKAGDLMSSFPKEMRAENLMCYIGHEGTYTPAHREMCASLGHNIMVEASATGLEDGKMTKAGTSIWFMTETKEREVVSEYWLSRLGHDIEIEKHFAQLNAWKHAPFKTYIVEQKPGDFILIPPLAPHQVWNRGTRTMKVAWNRTTVETLEMALTEALFKARFVCRDEQYKNKAMIYYTMQKYSKLLRLAERHKKSGIRTTQSDLKVQQLEKDFKRLHVMYTRILVSESFLQDKPEKKAEMVSFDSNITCSYCRCNIFNRFLTCPSCIGKLHDGEEDTYDICMECYAMGRSCACISKLRWVEQFEWEHLTQLHDQFRKQIISIEQKVDTKSPKSLKMELQLLSPKRTLAQICQIELSRRPWHDITKDVHGGVKDSDGVERQEEVELDINGNVKKTKKKIRRSEKYIREHGRCHVDCYWEPKWKQAQCSKCEKNFCYGNLFRAYDMMPQDIIADPNWDCPSCRKICGCRSCRNKPGYKKYTPRGTLLGHNTKAIADPRSVESLVDFSHSNIAWIQKAGDDHEENTLRLLRHKKDAELAKSRETELGDDYVDGPPENVEEQVLQLAQQEGIPIDPAIAGVSDTLQRQMDIEDEDAIVEHPEVPRHDPHAILESGIEQEQWVPEGGIIWDSAHAYDRTDAITYVYPDLLGSVSAQVPPAPAEGYEPIVPGYDEIAESDPGKIEMIDRKRKRAKMDEGDQAYHFRKKVPKPKSKVRKSLVVKLLVNKEKLAEIERASQTSGKVLEEATAPVVGSDLQTLNNDYETPNIPDPTKSVQAEPVEGDDNDHDDEFTPGRSRRKPAGDGAIRPQPDSDVTRRTTRMHAVTYADPSDGEEEFNETVLEKSKLVTMQTAARSINGTHNGRLHADTASTSTRPYDQFSRENVLLQKNAQKISATSNGTGSRQLQPPHTSMITTVPLKNHKKDSRPSSSPSAVLVQPSAKVMAEAQANRMAKMAAIEGDEDDSDDTDDGLSDEESPEPVSTSSRSLTTPTVGSKAPGLSVPSANIRRDTSAGPRPMPKPISAQKISEADWDDSSSDDDIPYSRQVTARKAASSFAAVNGNHMLSPKKRGRPVRAP